jgi:dTMP kinase
MALFITLEGIEGSGKTSLIDRIQTHLNSQGHACVVTREPGGTSIGKKIRTILLDPENDDLDAAAELLLYVADRVQHIKTVIQPQLALGRIVICDRFFDATKAYQGIARGLNPQLIEDLHRLTCDALRPDLTFLLDLDPEIGLQRAWSQVEEGGRTSGETRFENEKLAFHQRVRQAYLELARLEPERFRIIDAGGDKRQVAAQITASLDAFMASSEVG